MYTSNVYNVLYTTSNPISVGSFCGYKARIQYIFPSITLRMYYVITPCTCARGKVLGRVVVVVVVVSTKIAISRDIGV